MRNCVLVVGNGLSIGLLNSVGLSDKIKLTTLLPPDPSAIYIPFMDDRFRQRPLWDQEIWPRLWSEYYAWKSSPNGTNNIYDFFTFLANTQTLLFTDASSNSIKIKEFSHITFELRYYLWQLFRYHDRIWNDNTGWRLVDKWDWRDVLKRLRADYNLTIISFNYDCFLDSTLYIQGPFGVIPAPNQLLYHPKRCMEIFQIRKPGDVMLLKPHGSMMYNPYGGLISIGQNPWIDQIEDCEWSDLRGPGRRQYPVSDQCLLVPDLVPPGHNEKHLIDLDTDVVPAINSSISECDVLILCGLRAAEPDKAEVDRYLSNLRYGTPILHVDINRDNPAGKILKKYSPTGYKEIEVGEVATIPERL